MAAFGRVLLEIHAKRAIAANRANGRIAHLAVGWLSLVTGGFVRKAAVH
ncbi:hypothetical protein [Ruegeria atlantica]|nr:hypothetical protein [Ruegeria atlantica]